jgi:ATP-dependent Clp protease ATP-binding subunit ClpA
VLFAPLTHDQVRLISQKYLAQLTLTLAKAGKTIRLTDAALELIVTKGYNMAYGARFLKRMIDEHIKLPISSKWKDGSHFEVVAENGNIVVRPDVAPALTTAEALEFGDVA